MASHSMYNWTDKVDVKDGVNVHEMEHDGNAQKAEATKARHVEKKLTKAEVAKRVSE